MNEHAHQKTIRLAFSDKLKWDAEKNNYASLNADIEKLRIDIINSKKRIEEIDREIDEEFSSTSLNYCTCSVLKNTEFKIVNTTECDNSKQRRKKNENDRNKEEKQLGEYEQNLKEKEAIILCLQKGCNSCNNKCNEGQNEGLVKIFCDASDFTDIVLKNRNESNKLGINLIFDTDCYYPYNFYYNIKHTNNEIVLKRKNSIRTARQENLNDMGNILSSREDFFIYINNLEKDDKGEMANQSDSVSFLHAMKNKDESSIPKENFEKHLKNCFSEYLFLSNDNYSLFMLGIALHGIMDSFTPSHTNFQAYTKQDWGLHAEGDVIPFREDYIEHNVFEFQNKGYVIDENGFCIGVYERNEKGEMFFNQDPEILEHINRNQYQGNKEALGTLTFIEKGKYKDNTTGFIWEKLGTSANQEHFPHSSWLGGLINPIFKLNGIDYRAIKFLRENPEKKGEYYETIRYVRENEYDDKVIKGFNLTNKEIIERDLDKEYYKYVGTYNFGTSDNYFIKDWVTDMVGVYSKDGHYAKDYIPHKQGYNFYTQPKIVKNYPTIAFANLFFVPGQYDKEDVVKKTFYAAKKGYGSVKYSINNDINIKELEMFKIFLKIFNIDETKDCIKIFFQSCYLLKGDMEHIYYEKEGINNVSNEKDEKTSLPIFSLNTSYSKGNYNGNPPKKLTIKDINELLNTVTIDEKEISITLKNRELNEKTFQIKTPYIFSFCAIYTIREIFWYLHKHKTATNSYENYKNKLNKENVVDKAIEIWKNNYDKFIEKVNKAAIDPDLYKPKKSKD